MIEWVYLGLSVIQTFTTVIIAFMLVLVAVDWLRR
jgi:hypothetical protein